MSAKQKDLGSSPANDQKVLCRFFRFCETFFRNFFKCLQSVLPSFFFCFAKQCMFKNSQSPPPFYIFRHYATYRRPKKFKTISKESSEICFQFFPHAGTVEENT